MSSLRACPFCGSEETFTKAWHGENGGSFALAGCSRCGGRTQDHWPDEARAALEWNRRAPAADISGAGTSEAEARYAALGRACEANGLGWYIEDGTMRFQPPADAIAESAAYTARAPLEALRRLVANKDAFDASDGRNQADAYYCLVKGRDADWAEARAAIERAEAGR